MPRPVPGLLVAVALVLGVGRPASAEAHAARQKPRPTPLTQDALVVPGGVEAFVEALDLRRDLPPARVLLTAARVLWETPEGLDRASDRKRAAALEYLRRLEAPGQPTSASAPELVPAFLPEDTWAAILRHLEVKATSTVGGILGNRRAALFYHGVASLDPSTREYISARPGLWRRLLEPDLVGIFATLARALRVRDGAVQVPGGAAALPCWEEVAGEQAGRGERFIVRVLSRDEGRLALLYDGIAHLAEPARSFALGLHLDEDRRAPRFRALYDAAAAALRTWEPAKRPFKREPFDAVHLLLLTKVARGGRPAGPPWPRFWKAVFGAPAPREPRIEVRQLEEDAPFDAARLVDLLCVTGAVERAARVDTWLFAQRVFPVTAPGAANDLLPVLRSFDACPTLLLTLERMGIHDPSIYAAAVKAAGLLAGADRRQWQFQAALAILERARTAQAIDVAAASGLVRKLAALVPEDGQPFRGAIARWLEREFLPAAGEALLPAEFPSAGRPLETRVLAAMAGSVSSPANKRLLDLPALEWEGLRYRIDPGQSALRRFVEIRQRQGGPSLDEVLDAVHLADRIRDARSSSVALDAARLVADAVAPLEKYAATTPGGAARQAVLPSLGALARLVVERASRLRAEVDARTAARLVQPFLEAVDEYVGAVLGSLVYASFLGDADNPALLAGDPSVVHDFRRIPSRDEVGSRTSWQLPVEVRDPETGWRVTGALLCLDLAVGPLSLPHVPTDTMPAARDISETERLAFAESALSLTAFQLQETTRASLVAAIERGRERVTTAVSSGGEWQRLAADIDLDEWRAEALAWTASRHPGRLLELFSLGELASAGGLDAPAAELDGWGTGAFARGGAIGASYPGRLPWTTLAGRRGPRSSVAALVPDLVLGLAEASARLAVPAPLTAGLVLMASRDFMASLHPAHLDDWLAMIGGAQALARQPLDDYVAAMTVIGPLVPEIERQ